MGLSYITHCNSVEMYFTFSGTTLLERLHDKKKLWIHFIIVIKSNVSDKCGLMVLYSEWFPATIDVTKLLFYISHVWAPFTLVHTKF